MFLHIVTKKYNIGKYTQPLQATLNILCPDYTEKWNTEKNPHRHSLKKNKDSVLHVIQSFK